MIDAATISKHATPPPDSPYDTVPVHITFVDWIPGLCSTRELFCGAVRTDISVGYLVTALLDKSHLHSVFSGDSWGSDGPAAWRARVVLFLGVALMAGGLAGSLVSIWSYRPLVQAADSQTVLILKYIIPVFVGYFYYGGANVGMNAGIMIS